MRKILIQILFLSLCIYAASAQNTVKMSAVKANNYGVSYSLPKTAIDINVEYTKTIKKRGEYYEYATLYLNSTNPVLKDEVSYSVNGVLASSYGIVDKDKSYLVEFKSNTTAPFVSLTEDGLICAINEDYKIPAKVIVPAKEIVSVSRNTQSYLAEDVLKASSRARQAELIAKQIYSLREFRNEILTGEADNMPPDGEAYKLIMKQIDEQETTLTEMFIGTISTEVMNKNFKLTPDDTDIDARVVCRFSTKLGLVDANDLSGAPITLTLINKDPQPKVELTEKDQKALEKKFSKGIIYNIPNKASLSVSYDNKVVAKQEIEVVQYGVQEVLTTQMFDSRKQAIKVVFYPELGSIKQIIQ